MHSRSNLKKKTKQNMKKRKKKKKRLSDFWSFSTLELRFEKPSE